MPDKFTVMTPQLHAYAIEHGARQDDVLRSLAEETERIAGEMAIMQVSPDQGALITLLARAIGARSAIELGTFTGYSAICIARGLRADGRLIACEINEEHAAVARRYFAEAGVKEQVELAIGPALETLRAMPEREQFDFAFIDADKETYPDYYEELIPRLGQGGLVMVDNVFRDGAVVDPDDDSERTRAIQELNVRIAADDRVDVAMLGISDGVTLALKR
jgi:caffeoyl-CoA O-methyltransferase